MDDIDKAKENTEMLHRFGMAVKLSIASYLRGRAREAPSIDTMLFTMNLADEVEEAELCKEKGTMS